MAAINTFYRNYDASDNTSIEQSVTTARAFPSPSSFNWLPQEGCYFKGWSEYRNNTSVLYQPGDNFPKDEEAYYAIWTRYLSRIKLNGIEYDIKDAIARSNVTAINNAGYQTASDVNSLIATAIGNINQFNVAIVSTLPTTNIDNHTIYFKENEETGNNIYDEYMYIDDSWELIGSTATDLSGYLQTSDIADWAKAANKPTYTASEVGALPDTTVIPTVPSNISAFTNDVGYISSYNEIDPIFSTSAAAGISSTDIANWNAKSDFSGSYNDLEDKPSIPTVPTNVSAFNNDAGYLTSYTETDPTVPSWAKASSKPTYTAFEVGALPSSTTYVSSFNGSTGAITYTAPVTSVNGQTGAVSLTIPAAQVQSNWNATTGVTAILNKPSIPTDISDLTDSQGLIPDLNETLASVAFSGSYDDLAQAPDPDDYLLKTDIYDWAKTDRKPGYTASEVGALPSDTTYVSSINGQSGAVTLTIPTDTSDLTNNAGYITSYTETDPTVPSWAKAESKPTYTASEVGALPSSTTYVSSVNGANGAITVDKIQTTAANANSEYNLIGTASTNNNTTAVSAYQQDLLSFAKTSNLSRLTIGSTSMPGVVRIYTSADSASGFTDIKSNASSTNERTITLPDASGTVALTTDIPSVPSWALANNKPSYTFSELTSHPTTLNDYGITDAYTKTEVDGLVSGILHYKGTKSTVSALPSSNNVTGDVWHVTADGSEWAWDGSEWQELGTTVDLSGYLQTGDISAWAKAANKPSYTASEVGALPSSTTYVSSFNGNTGAITYTAPVTSVNEQTGAVTITASSINAASATHAHGSITSAGDITTTATIASGDRIVINDESASKITNSSITFGSSTAQYLANNGTWQNVPAAVSVSNTLSSGTLIATINGTNIYAPTYTDADGVSY